MKTTEKRKIEIKVEKVNVMGMDLTRWTLESCEADFGEGKNEDGTEWVTLYTIKSKAPGMGHATALLWNAKKNYEGKGRKFGGSIALNERMRAIYKRLEITEYL